jgi:hypothetical protein
MGEDAKPIEEPPVELRMELSTEGLLKLTLLALYRQTAELSEGPDRAARIQEKYDALFDNLRTIGFYASDPFNAFSNGTQYYAWNLRFTRAAAVWLLADDDEKPIVEKYVNRWMFKHVKGHKNAWFTFIYAMMTTPTDQDIVADGVLSLKSWSLRPKEGWPSPYADGWNRDYKPPNAVERVAGTADDRVLWPHLRKPTMYWTWQKGPWDAGQVWPNSGFDGVTLDLLLPYWMARYHGFLD